MNFWNTSTESKTAATSAWLDSRRLGIGGSEIGIILGRSPYRTPYSLWLEKTGKERPTDISALPHVQRGIQGEKSCRLLLERSYLTSFTPKTWQLAGSICRCSDDGYSLDRNWILEIKCMGRDAHEAASRGEVPEHYRLQCQWNLMVSGAKRCLFVSYKPETEEMHEIWIDPDVTEQAALRTVAESWWEKYVVGDTAPALTPKDVIECPVDEFQKTAEAYALVKRRFKEDAERLEKLSGILATYLRPEAPAIRSEAHGVTVRKMQKRGTVDWKKVPHGLATGELDKYRKAPSHYVKVSLEGEDTNERAE